MLAVQLAPFKNGSRCNFAGRKWNKNKEQSILNVQRKEGRIDGNIEYYFAGCDKNKLLIANN